MHEGGSVFLMGKKWPQGSTKYLDKKSENSIVRSKKILVLKTLPNQPTKYWNTGQSNTWKGSGTTGHSKSENESIEYFFSFFIFFLIFFLL